MVQIIFYFYFNFNTLSTCNEVRYTATLEEGTALQLIFSYQFGTSFWSYFSARLENFRKFWLHQNDVLGRVKITLNFAQEIRVVYDHDTWKNFPPKDKKPEKKENFFPLNNKLALLPDGIQDIYFDSRCLQMYRWLSEQETDVGMKTLRIVILYLCLWFH